MSLSSHQLVGSAASTALRALRRLAARPSARRYAVHYEDVLGTSLELQVVATSGDVAKRAELAVLSEIDRLAAILSGYSATSELSRWQATFGVDVAVSPELAEVLDSAERWRVSTGGAFNAAAVSLVALLRDDVERRGAVSDRLAEMDHPLWAVDLARGTARRLTRLTVSLDALAKGFIVERAAACGCAVHGVSQLLLNIGGDLRHHGPRELTVGVANPHAPAENAPPVATVQLRGDALATSGGYRRGFVANGRRVSHILDPRTGQPAGDIASASVFAPDCATADALSTAFSVMTPRESVALADTLAGVGCLLVGSDGSITTNAAWDARTLTSAHDTTHHQGFRP